MNCKPLAAAFAYLGVRETAGPKSNPQIRAWILGAHQSRIKRHLPGTQPLEALI